jgi:hypothetical protein
METLASNGDVAGPEFLLHGLVLHGANEAGTIAGGEELFWIGARLAGSAERGRSGKVEVDATVGAANLAIAAVLCGHFCGVESLDEREHGVDAS